MMLSSEVIKLEIQLDLTFGFASEFMHFSHGLVIILFLDQIWQFHFNC